ncbi:putative ankyrin repeat protein [Planoprotostelium fungivorum]|uniref:Putative ankyrin repeat protein n=1 Tax=Planoprotostelium fungivorum TaxID=1890364 RepID=A0A2P6NJC3_9EUKA|nr:putative ankyrin repeat protein [Planoprotostelium fungivorum]
MVCALKRKHSQPNPHYIATNCLAIRTMDELPNETLTSILTSYVCLPIYWCSARSVCRRWKVISDEVFDFSQFKALEKCSIKNSTAAIKLFLSLKQKSQLSLDEALSLASQFGSLGVIKILLEDGRANPTYNHCCCLRLACANGHVEVVRLLIQLPSVDVSAGNNYAIHCAASVGNVEITKLLLDSGGVIPSANDNSALRMAAWYGHSEVLQLLLQHGGVDPAAKDNSPIRDASERGHDKVVAILLEDPRVDPTSRGQCALRMACACNRVKVVELLLKDERMKPEAENNAALRIAAEAGSTEIVDLLLKMDKVDPSDVNNQAIYAAVHHNRLDTLKRLLEDPRVDPTEGQHRALREAIRKGQTEVENLLRADHRSREHNSIDHNSIATRDMADFTTGLFGCFEDISSCLLTCFCLPITHAKNEALLAERECGISDLCCAFLATPTNIYFNRRHIRSKHSMDKGQECSDCCVAVFCAPCATCQHHRELQGNVEALLQLVSVPTITMR